MVATRSGLTLAEFLALPEEEVALEYADGEVTQKVSPQGKHSTLQADLAAGFNAIFRPRKIARAFTELRATWAGMSPVPNVSVYRWERIPRDARNRVADRFDTPPDIAVEIVSPEQSVNRLIRRCLRFAATVVPLTLLLDPMDESVLEFRPDEPPRALTVDDAIDLGHLLAGASLRVADIFAMLQMD